MKSSTDRNLNYRYKITQNPEDVTASTYRRRLFKKNQSRAKQFIFDLTEVPSHELKSKQSFLDQSSDPVYLQYSPHLDLSMFPNRKTLLKIATGNDCSSFLERQSEKTENVDLVFAPNTKKSAEDLTDIIKKYPGLNTQWNFESYNPQIKHSLTVADVQKNLKTCKNQRPEIPFWNSAIPEHYELESLQNPIWSFNTPQKNILISIIIPTYNNCLFLSNVIQHLFKQSISHENYEVIIVDDGSTDYSQETIRSLIQTSLQNINIKYIYWSKTNPDRGEQNFFRAGLARNIGVEHSEGDKLLFLDSDMLVYEDFVKTCINELEANDVIQFSRLHIKQVDSKKNPRFHHINPKEQTYIEEEVYWNQLFTTNDWNQMTHYWKYTCTYALGMSRQDFYECGRFKRHYVSYGFEDTDIGFLMAKKNKKFKLIKQHLLHLTNYSTMQYQNSKYLREQLLRKTSKLLFLDHLDPEIYEVFYFYYNFEKPLFHHIRDAF
jgi:glycosyltransferase involved in cell wall biosynthesis